MNAREIKMMLKNIQKDFMREGRPYHVNDDYVIDLLMRMYYQTVEFDWEELKWLYENYMKTGTLDFRFAKILGSNRIFLEKMGRR